MNITQLKAPDWRWQTAKAYVSAQTSGQGLQMQPDDPLVLYVIRMLKAMQNPASRQFVRTKMPQLYQVIQLGSTKGDAAMRAKLQICIIAGQQQDIDWLDQMQLKFYKDIFFDIDQTKLAAPQWVQDQLLGTVRSKAMSRVHRARKLAAHYGADIALQALNWGELSGKAKDALVRMFKSQRIKGLADYCITPEQTDPTTLANIMNTTFNKMQDRQLQLQLKNQPGAQDKSLSELAHGIQQAIRTYTAAQMQAAAGQGADDAQTVIDRLKQD